MSDSSAAALHLGGLRFRYHGARDHEAARGGNSGAWTVAIDDFSLAAGEQALLTGGSGSGKSTLLQIIAGLMEPDEGRVRVAGTDIHELRGAKRDLFRGGAIGMIFQTFQLLHGFSGLENVMAALMFSKAPPKEHRTRAAEALERLGITRMGAPVEELSVGQQQRVAVARAVVCNPALVLADEPTASLDPANAKGAMDLIQTVCRERGAALLCVSHDVSLTERFARRVSLEALREGAGAMAARGTGGG